MCTRYLCHQTRSQFSFWIVVRKYTQLNLLSYVTNCLSKKATVKPCEKCHFICALWIFANCFSFMFATVLLFNVCVISLVAHVVISKDWLLVLAGRCCCIASPANCDFTVEALTLRLTNPLKLTRGMIFRNRCKIDAYQSSSYSCQ